MGKVKYSDTIKSKRASWSKYTKKNLKAFTFKLSLKYDAELIEFIQSLENKTDTFRQLFTDYMNKSDRD